MENNSWECIVSKGEFKIGDLGVYFEIDSMLPCNSIFSMFESKKMKTKNSDGSEGYRLRTIKLRGIISQGLILPISVLNPPDTNIYVEPFEGLEVTEMLGIVKYEPPIPAELAGKVKGGFPSFIPKTDEERVQNLTSEYDGWRFQSKHQFYVTEKLDGSSATFYFKDGVFGVCSRNLELLETEGNTFWKVARQLKLEEWLGTHETNYSIQGELIGESVQGNPYKIKGQTVRFYNAFNIDTQEYLGFPDFIKLIDSMGLETVPVLDINFMLPDTVEELLKYADAKSALNPNFDREGVVIRSFDRTISFKVISNKFLLNEK
jgi:RNA ligase (TIGR02306 family)